MKPSISGRRIRSCMPIQAPNEKPAIQQLRASGLTDCAQSSAAAASDNSPMPWSKPPWLRPTPRMWMQHDANRRVFLPRLVVTALDAASGSGKNDLGHGFQTSIGERRLELLDAATGRS